MIGKQLLKTEHVELEIEGKGKTLRLATSDVFKAIHKQIYTVIQKPVIALDTKEVYYDAVERSVSKRTLQKDTEQVHIRARVVLEVKYLDIEEEDI